MKRLSPEELVRFYRKTSRIGRPSLGRYQEIIYIFVFDVRKVAVLKLGIHRDLRSDQSVHDWYDALPIDEPDPEVEGILASYKRARFNALDPARAEELLRSEEYAAKLRQEIGSLFRVAR